MAKKKPTVIVKYLFGKINKNQQETNNEQPWKKKRIVRYTMKHINTENQWTSIRYNEQHLKNMKCNEHLWRKDNEHVEVKTNKNN